MRDVNLPGPLIFADDDNEEEKSFSTDSFEASFGQDLDDGDSGSDSHLSGTKKLSR